MLAVYDNIHRSVKRKQFASHLCRWRSAGITHMYFIQNRLLRAGVCYKYME